MGGGGRLNVLFSLFSRLQVISIPSKKGLTTPYEQPLSALPRSRPEEQATTYFVPLYLDTHKLDNEVS